MQLYNAKGQPCDVNGNPIVLATTPPAPVSTTETLLQDLLNRLTPPTVENTPVVNTVVNTAETDLAKSVADKVQPILSNLHDRLSVIEQRTFGVGHTPFSDFVASL